MLLKKSIYLKNKPERTFYAKFKKDFLFYPTNSIKLVEGDEIKTIGKLYLHIYKISSNLYFNDLTIFPLFLSLGCTKKLQSLVNNSVRLYVIDNKLENKDEQREFLMHIKKIYVLKDQKNKNLPTPSILIIFPNQTSFVQLVRTFFSIIKKRLNHYSTRKNFKNILSKTSIKLKYGKIVMSADNRNNFQDGNIDQFRICGIIVNKTINISKTFGNSNIFFTTPLSLKRDKELMKLFNNINLYWLDSVEMMLMQNSENLLYIVKTLVEIRMNFIYTNSGLLKSYKKNKLIFKMFITSSLLPEFLIRLFFGLSFSSYNFSKNLEKTKTNGVLISCKNFFNDPVSHKNEISSLYLIQFLKIKFKNFLYNKKHFNLLVFVKNYSDLIPIRNSLQRLKRKMSLKINIFSEYLENGGKKPSKQNLFYKENAITLMTERYFYYLRYLYFKFNSVYFHTYPFNKEYYYEILKQTQF